MEQHLVTYTETISEIIQQGNNGKNDFFFWNSEIN